MPGSFVYEPKSRSPLIFNFLLFFFCFILFLSLISFILFIFILIKTVNCADDFACRYQNVEWRLYVDLFIRFVWSLFFFLLFSVFLSCIWCRTFFGTYICLFYWMILNHLSFGAHFTYRKQKLNKILSFCRTIVIFFLLFFVFFFWVLQWQFGCWTIYLVTWSRH